MDAATSLNSLPSLHFSKSNKNHPHPSLHACEVKCRSSLSSDITGSTFPNLQLRTPVQNRSLAGKTFCSAGVWTHPLSASESHSHVEEEKVGVLLLNLGGPETLNDVQPFLYNLFADPDIIRLPRLFRFLQRPLAQLISTLRAPKSKEGYASIGGGSPLRKITDEQADALRMALEAKEVPANVYVAMRYWHPFTEEAVQQIKRGESEGSFQFANYPKEIDDLHAVIQHFTASNRVISAILGHSKGGTVVVLYVSLHHNIPRVVNVSGRYNMDSGMEERLGKDYLERAKQDGFIDIISKTGRIMYRVTEESLMEWMNTNMYEACIKIDKDCRVLTVHGSADEVIPVEDAVEFSKIIPNHELRIIEGANHGYSKRRDELVSTVLAFIKDNLHRE